MLERADEKLAAPAAEQAAAPAITVEQFPGLCMGVSMLTSLALHKGGFDPLTKEEGDALTAALLKNAQAWELQNYLGNPKVAAALDLGGCLVAILMPRVIADAKKRAAPSSPTQARAAANDDAPITPAA